MQLVLGNSLLASYINMTTVNFGVNMEQCSIMQFLFPITYTELQINHILEVETNVRSRKSIVDLIVWHTMFTVI